MVIVVVSDPTDPSLIPVPCNSHIANNFGKVWDCSSRYG